MFYLQTVTFTPDVIHRLSESVKGEYGKQDKHHQNYKFPSLWREPFQTAFQPFFQIVSQIDYTLFHTHLSLYGLQILVLDDGEAFNREAIRIVITSAGV